MRGNRTTKIFLLSVLITGLVIGAFGGGVGVTWLVLHGRTANAEEASGFSVFWEAWHLIEKSFYGDLPDTQHLAWGAIRGAMETLNDPHSTFLEPQPRQREKENLSGRFGGIGAYVSQAPDGSIVLDPMPDLPAERAGIQKGDAILEIDDTPLAEGATVDDVVTLLRGDVGTEVKLALRRAGQEAPVTVEITREEIPTPSVEWRMLEEAPGTGYVRITIFSDRTGRELTEALDELNTQGMTKLILDLRGNGGGLLGAAIDVSDQFLSDGVILYEAEKGEPDAAKMAKRGGEYLSGPMVVLVDGGTASASEIVTGALQDRDRATIVGEKTYGKGSVQSVFDLSDGSSIHVTSAQWFTPNHHQISGEGLSPDVEVSITEDDRNQGLDPQLQRAIEFLASGEW
jgi:carboxyl-terminal processing protease